VVGVCGNGNGVASSGGNLDVAMAGGDVSAGGIGSEQQKRIFCYGGANG